MGTRLLERFTLGCQAPIRLGRLLRDLCAFGCDLLLEGLEPLLDRLKLCRAGPLERDEVPFGQAQRGNRRRTRLAGVYQRCDPGCLVHYVQVSIVIAQPVVHLIALCPDLERALFLRDARHDDRPQIAERCCPHKHAGDDPVDVREPTPAAREGELCGQAAQFAAIDVVLDDGAVLAASESPRALKAVFFDMAVELGIALDDRLPDDEETPAVPRCDEAVLHALAGRIRVQHGHAELPAAGVLEDDVRRAARQVVVGEGFLALFTLEHSGSQLAVEERDGAQERGLPGGIDAVDVDMPIEPDFDDITLSIRVDQNDAFQVEVVSAHEAPPVEKRCPMVGGFLLKVK